MFIKTDVFVNNEISSILIGKETDFVKEIKIPFSWTKEMIL